MGKTLKFITTYHPQIDEKLERTNHILEGMLRIYVMDKQTKWENYFDLVEFAYNNVYQTFFKMSHFEAIYGKKFKVAMTWYHLEGKFVLGPDMLKEVEGAVKQARHNLKKT